MLSVGHQRWSQPFIRIARFCENIFSNISLLASSWILFYEASKRIMFFPTLFINSVVCWSPKMVTTFYTHWKVFRQHLSNNSLLATSWILFYEALKRIMFITTLFINSVFCWSPKMVTTFYSHRKVFRRHLSHVFSSNFMNSVLRSFEAYNVYYHFIHQQCFLLVTNDGHNLLFASQGFSTTSFSPFCTSNFLNSVLQCFETYIASYHFVHQ